MASSVIKAFNEFISNTVNLDPAQTATARASREWLITQIQGFQDQKTDFPQIYSGKNLHYGSFARKVKTRPLDDIDMMICLKADNCTYQENIGSIDISVPDSSKIFLPYVDEGTNILNSRKLINAYVAELKNVHQYKNADIKRNQEAATLSLNSYDWVYDIVPCFFTKEDEFKRTYYIIPNGSGKWKKTDPRIDDERINTIDEYHNGHVRPVIRAIKYWNKRPTMPTMPSYLLENIILNFYNGQIQCATVYVDIETVKVFEFLKNNIFNIVNDPKGIQGNLNTLSYEEKTKIFQRTTSDLQKSIRAREAETKGDHKESIKLWREIFGDDFPQYTEQ